MATCRVHGEIKKKMFALDDEMFAILCMEWKADYLHG